MFSHHVIVLLTILTYETVCYLSVQLNVRYFGGRTGLRGTLDQTDSSRVDRVYRVRRDCFLLLRICQRFHPANGWSVCV